MHEGYVAPGFTLQLDLTKYQGIKDYVVNLNILTGL